MTGNNSSTKQHNKNINNMKKILTFFLLTAFAISSIYAQDLKQGLVAYYPFNGNANDESGNGNNGSVYGATLTADKNGNKNSAYSFDGDGDYINCGYKINLRNSSFTISIIEKIAFNNGKNPSIMGQGTATTNEGLHLMWGKDYFRFAFYGNDLNTAKDVFDANIWRNWVFTYDVESKKRKIYLNNRLVANDIATKYAGSGNLIIGNSSLWANDYSGVIDDIRIYNRALGRTEVRDLFNLEQKAQKFTRK